MRIADEIVVDLLKDACGVDYARASAGGVEIKTIEGVPIPVDRKELRAPKEFPAPASKLVQPQVLE